MAQATTKVISMDMAKSMMSLLRKRTFDIKFDLDDTPYKHIEKIGSGAYGVVCSAIHKKTGDKVAIKKIPSVFDVDATALRTYREIKVLKHFKHDNIISIREILKPKESLDSFCDVYVVLDLMESDLHRIIHSQQDLTDEHIRYFLYQILRGLKYIHSANVIHRDLKPSNLLINEDCQLKIGDFGMARGIASSVDERNPFMTQYVATRWYRAPEILMSHLKYSICVDMWSVGCIFAEMLSRKPLFPGRDYISQLKMIIGVLGTPPNAFQEDIQSELIGTFVQELGQKESVNWIKLFPSANRKSLDLLSKMLSYHPKDRITAKQALSHPYLNKYHDPDDEPICIPAFNFDFEKERLRGNPLRTAIVKEIMDYHQVQKLPGDFSAILKPVHKSTCDSPIKVENDPGKDDCLHEKALGLKAFLTPKTEENSGTLNSVPSSCQSSVSHQFQGAGALNTVSDLPQKLENIHFKLPQPPGTQTVGYRIHVDKKPGTYSYPTDIEMLSAKLGSGDPIPILPKPSQGSSVLKLTTVEVKPENRTISEDTKALIKAALLGGRKNRADANADSDKPRPVTALQRQREREEKRKQKLQRMQVKKKTSKKKKGRSPGIGLSSEDKELLSRWANMQENIKPPPRAIRPKPAINKPGLSTVDISNNAPAVQYYTLLSTTSVVNNTVLNTPRLTQQQLSSNNTNVNTNKSIDISASNNHSIQQQSDLTPVALSDMGFNNGSSTLMSYTQKTNYLADALTDANQNRNVHLNVATEARTSVNLNTYESGMIGQVMVPPSQGTSEIQTDSRQSKDVNNVLVNNTSVLVDLTSAGVTPTDRSRPNSATLPYSFENSSHSSPTTSQSDTTSTPSRGLSPYLTDDLFFGNEQVQTSVDKASFDGSGVQSQLAPDPSNNFMNSISSLANSHIVQADSQNISQLHIDSQIEVGNNDQDMLSATPLQEIPKEASDQSNIPSHAQNITLAETSLSEIPSLSQEVARTTSMGLTPGAASDLIAILTKQFSKSQVEDPLPPALAVTPKGTGGGYGVGLDLDCLMNEVIDVDSVKLDSAPLSASLLADWMEVTGNMSAFDLEALIAESGMTSPMAISLTDFNLSASS